MTDNIDIMGVHRQSCPDCGKLLVYDKEEMVYGKDAIDCPSPESCGGHLRVTYKKCKCQEEDHIKARTLENAE